MFKMVTFTQPLPGLSAEEFHRHYTETHFDLAVQMPGLVSYEQFRVLHGDTGWRAPDHFPGYRSFSVYTFESRADAFASFASSAGVATDEDSRHFILRSSVREAGVEPLRRFGSSTG